MDTSWIDLYEDEEKYYTLFYPEKAHEIKVNMLYINKDNELYRIGENMIYLNVADKINRNELVKLIKENNKLDKIRYKLSGIRIYNIDLKHNDLKHFMTNPNKYDFMTELRNIEDYMLETTINCLQNLNCIYILFTEENDDDISKRNDASSNTNGKNNHTKRVKFNIETKRTRKRK